MTNTEDDADAALFATLERLERQMAAAIARARESVVALEYTAPDAPSGTRRVATGVVINHRGEVLSVNIDPPPASAGSNRQRTVRHGLWPLTSQGVVMLFTGSRLTRIPA